MADLDEYIRIGMCQIALLACFVMHKLRPETSEICREFEDECAGTTQHAIFAGVVTLICLVLITCVVTVLGNVLYCVYRRVMLCFVGPPAPPVDKDE